MNVRNGLEGPSTSTESGTISGSVYASKSFFIVSPPSNTTGTFSSWFYPKTDSVSLERFSTVEAPSSFLMRFVSSVC